MFAGDDLCEPLRSGGEKEGCHRWTETELGIDCRIGFGNREVETYMIYI